MRHLLTVMGALLLAGCGGKEEAPAAEKGADPTRSAAEAITADARPQLTLADAERVGFVRQEAVEHSIDGVTEAAGGTLEGGRVEIFVHQGPPTEGVRDFLRQVLDAGFGFTGICEVGNLVMLYQDEAACQVLRTLER